MFRRIELHNFRSCRQVVLDDLGPLALLVGRNAAGKSNILAGIQWLAAAGTSSDVASVPNGFPQSEMSVAATIEECTYEYSIRFDVFPVSEQNRSIVSLSESLHSCRNGGPVEVVFKREGDSIELGGGETMSVARLTAGMPAILALLPDASPAKQSIRPFFSQLRNVRYYLMESESANRRLAIARSEYDDWLRHYQVIGDPGASVVLRILHLALSNDPRFDELERLLGPDGLGIVDSLEITRLSDPQPRAANGTNEDEFYLVRFQTNASHGFEELSAGTQRVVRILVSLLFDRASLTLLEHPEDGIHRGLLHKLIGLLETYSDRTQLIVSSHSPEVANRFEPEAVRLVTMNGGQTPPAD